MTSTETLILIHRPLQMTERQDFGKVRNECQGKMCLHTLLPAAVSFIVILQDGLSGKTLSNGQHVNWHDGTFGKLMDFKDLTSNNFGKWE